MSIYCTWWLLLLFLCFLKMVSSSEESVGSGMERLLHVLTCGCPCSFLKLFCCNLSVLRVWVVCHSLRMLWTHYLMNLSLLHCCMVMCWKRFTSEAAWCLRSCIWHLQVAMPFTAMRYCNNWSTVDDCISVMEVLLLDGTFLCLCLDWWSCKALCLGWWSCKVSFLVVCWWSCKTGCLVLWWSCETGCWSLWWACKTGCCWPCEALMSMAWMCCLVWRYCLPWDSR